MTEQSRRAAPPSARELQRLSDLEGNGWVDRQSTSQDEEEVLRLAALSSFDYDRIRSSAAEGLGVRVETLDREVRRRRASDAEGHSILEDPGPWEHPVDGAGLLRLIVGRINEHLILPAMAAETLALWIMHAHAFEATTISPLLAATSPTPACGKTTLLTLLAALVPRPLPASNITSAALFRAIEKWRPTMVIDEADTFLKNSDELRGIVNSGHNRKQAYVIRSVGENHEPMRFSTWAPKAIALIGKLPATLDSRSIHIELRRMALTETVQALRSDQLDHLEPLSRMAWRWAKDNVSGLKALDPDLPGSLRGRIADNWRPLIAIADLMGDEWPDVARRAAETLSASRSESTTTIILLSDIRLLFVESTFDRLLSDQIVRALAAIEGRPWAEWKAGKPLSTNQLAGLLRPFKIEPRTMRIAGQTPGKRGYTLSQFADSFGRYLPDLGSQTATLPQSHGSAIPDGATPLRDPGSVAVATSLKPPEALDCGGVAVYGGAESGSVTRDALP